MAFKILWHQLLNILAITHVYMCIYIQKVICTYPNIKGIALWLQPSNFPLLSPKSFFKDIQLFYPSEAAYSWHPLVFAHTCPRVEYIAKFLVPSMPTLLISWPPSLSGFYVLDSRPSSRPILCSIFYLDDFIMPTFYGFMYTFMNPKCIFLIPLHWISCS